jgi:hypothetical protein
MGLGGSATEACCSAVIQPHNASADAPANATRQNITHPSLRLELGYLVSRRSRQGSKSVANAVPRQPVNNSLAGERWAKFIQLSKQSTAPNLGFCHRPPVSARRIVDFPNQGPLWIAVTNHAMAASQNSAAPEPTRAGSINRVPIAHGQRRGFLVRCSVVPSISTPARLSASITRESTAPV